MPVVEDIIWIRTARVKTLHRPNCCQVGERASKREKDKSLTPECISYLSVCLGYSFYAVENTALSINPCHGFGMRGGPSGELNLGFASTSVASAKRVGRCEALSKQPPHSGFDVLVQW